MFCEKCTDTDSNCTSKILALKNSVVIFVLEKVSYACNVFDLCPVILKGKVQRNWLHSVYSSRLEHTKQAHPIEALSDW